MVAVVEVVEVLIAVVVVVVVVFVEVEVGYHFPPVSYSFQSTRASFDL